MTKLLCKQCNKEYEAKRSTSRYCSAKCRKLAFQNVKPRTLKVSPEEAAKIQVSSGVTDKPDVGFSVVDGVAQIDLAKQPKRGADIKTFEDLPPDVQDTIEIMSSRPDAPADDKAMRTARAIEYQHLCPDRYESTGFAVACLQTIQAAPVQPICS